MGDIRKANNGKNPVLAKKYRVVTDARNDRQLSLQLIEEIHRTFPLDINKAYYKSHPNEYLVDRDRIQQFLDYKRCVLDKIEHFATMLRRSETATGTVNIIHCSYTFAR